MAPRPPGRPRAAAPREGVSTQEEILQASDRLFCAQGYGPTSTHAIAREARISQASLYHHFSGKQAVLLALLLRTVRPSADLAEQLVADRGAPAAERLRRLCAYDVHLLASAAENTGLLYSLPEVRDPAFAPFRAERQRLFEAYRALVAETLDARPGARGPGGADPSRCAAMVLALVESVITRRLDGLGGLDEHLPEQVADAAMRLVLG